MEIADLLSAYVAECNSRCAEVAAVETFGAQAKAFAEAGNIHVLFSAAKKRLHHNVLAIACRSARDLHLIGVQSRPLSLVLRDMLARAERDAFADRLHDCFPFDLAGFTLASWTPHQ